MKEYKVIVIDAETGAEYEDTVDADGPNDALKYAYMWENEQ